VIENNDQERRLRELHGVLERALMIAADALSESHPEFGARQWFEHLMRTSGGQLEEAEAFRGRWSLFTDDEMEALEARLIPAGIGTGSVVTARLAYEVETDLMRRGKHPSSEPSTVVHKNEEG
jgi:hypothetical protein